ASAVQSASEYSVVDTELEELLQRVYVEGGFTDPEVAKSAFAAGAVRARGEILVVRDHPGGDLQGMVIVVLPTSPARRIAEANETERHLLAVSPSYRGRGTGSTLIQGAIDLAKGLGYARMVLWTQPTMVAAQRLYKAAGFVREPHRDFQTVGRQF